MTHLSVTRLKWTSSVGFFANHSSSKLASGPDYGTYFYDVTTGNNQTNPSIPGYPATTGWDPVTGLGTPNGPLAGRLADRAVITRCRAQPRRPGCVR